MAKLREIILCTTQDRVLGRVLVKALRAQRLYWRARCDLREFIGCDPDCDDWLFTQWSNGALNNPTADARIRLARDFVQHFGDTESEEGVEPPGM